MLYAQGLTPLDYALITTNWHAVEVLVVSGALEAWGALCRQREAVLRRGLDSVVMAGSGGARGNSTSASRAVLSLPRQLEVAAGLIQAAAARLPSGLSRWGQWVASLVAPGDAQTRAIEEEVARALSAGGAAGGVAVSMDPAQVVAAVRAAVARVADVLQVGCVGGECM